MNQSIKLVLALHQIDNLTSLLEGNEYQSFLYSNLIKTKVELERQLTNEQHTAKLKK